MAPRTTISNHNTTVRKSRPFSFFGGSVRSLTVRTIDVITAVGIQVDRTCTKLSKLYEQNNAGTIKE